MSHVKFFRIFNLLLHIVDCEWATWEEWMECTATCGGGVKIRTRRTLTCTNALSCKGSFIEQKICSTESCPDLSTLKADVATLKTDGKNINEYILRKCKDIYKQTPCLIHIDVGLYFSEFTGQNCHIKCEIPSVHLETSYTKSTKTYQHRLFSWINVFLIG